MLQKSPVEKFTTWVGSVPSLITHTFVFASAFALSFFKIMPWDFMLLVLTTLVSLEAIYLAIFIQMTVNRQSAELASVSEDVEDVQEDIEGIVQDVDEIQKDVDEIQEDVDEIQKDVDEIQEDVEDISDDTDEHNGKQSEATIEKLTEDVRRILTTLEELKNKN